MARSRKKDAAVLVGLRHSVELHWSDEDEAWLAAVPDLPGCVADGATQLLALKAANAAAALWLRVAKAQGRPSSEAQQPSGKFVVRMPKALHRRLQVLAEREGVSLNLLVNTLLAEREALRSRRQ